MPRQAEREHFIERARSAFSEVGDLRAVMRACLDLFAEARGLHLPEDLGEADPRALALLRGALDYADAEVEVLGETYAALLPGADRRRSGTHYTPRDLTREVVAEALRPVLSAEASALSLRVCDPAMGCGAFLLEVCRQLGAVAGSKAAVARRCLCGVDLDPLAVTLTRWSLWLEVGEAVAVPGLRQGDALVMDWSAAFPEVVGEGFDVVVGNPPFLGVTTLSTSRDPSYTRGLRERWPDSGGKCDLSAYFFRLGFARLRPGGTLGFIATNTIGQGDTRESGLVPILRSGGWIYRARRRLTWPGRASVVASVVHLQRLGEGAVAEAPVLDGHPASRISAFLLEGDADTVPADLSPVVPVVTKGVVPYGVGFVVGERRGNIPPARLAALLAEEPSSARWVRPYLGGRGFNRRPDQAPVSRIINIDHVEDIEAFRAAHPGLVALLEAHVRPGREALRRQSGARALKRQWWRYQYSAAELFGYIAASGVERVLAVARVTPHLALAFLPADITFNEKLIIFPSDSAAFFAVLQSRLHETWVRTFTSTMKDDLNYSPTDCFHNFPFPPTWDEPASDLLAAGAAYHEHRAAVMLAAGEGLTATYNRFHDPDCALPGIVRLRALHDALDRTVLAAYGWADLAPRCEFLLDYAIDEESWPPRRRKPFRYRWPDDLRDEVLTRLMALNRQRAAEGGR